MNCKELEKYDRGDLDEIEFELHAASCQICRQALQLHREIDSQAKLLRQPISAPHLWDRIDKALQEEKDIGPLLSQRTSTPKELKKERSPFHRKYLRIVTAAAVSLAIIGIGIYFGVKNSAPTSGLLAQKALIRVEQKEQEYQKAIDALEKQAFSQMDDLNLELVFLYRTRLETIDAQIEQCREALVLNPANAHIRGYLMAALQDKKETLVEVLSLEDESFKFRRTT